MRPQPHKRAGPVSPLKPVIAQAKNSAIAPNRRLPFPVRANDRESKPLPQANNIVASGRHRLVAPPVYRPNPLSRVCQPKGTPDGQRKATPDGLRKLPAPAPYKPNPVPRVLQPKRAAHAVVAQGNDKRVISTRTLPVKSPPPVPRPVKPSKTSVVQARPSGRRFDAVQLAWAPVPKQDVAKIHVPVSKQEKAEEKQRKKDNFTASELQKADAEAAEKLKLEIASFNKKQNWWHLYGLDYSLATAVKETNTKLNGIKTHITVVKESTSDPDFTKDAIDTIVNKTIGADNVMNSVHATKETHGQVNSNNPKYYRNGTSPNCSEGEKTALKDILDEFVAYVRAKVTAKKDHYFPQPAAAPAPAAAT